MELETVISNISSVGFPIVACWFMWKYINTTMKDFTNIINENTRMLSKLCERLEIINERSEKSAD